VRTPYSRAAVTRTLNSSQLAKTVGMSTASSQLKLVVASKTYSSWSMRPWILLKVHRIPFHETLLKLDHYDDPSKGSFPQDVRAHGGEMTAGKCPILIEADGSSVWDSLAICERIAELRPDLPLWPRNAKARALARSVVAEMHSGFMDMRSNLYFNATARYPASMAQKLMQDKPAVAKDVKRVLQIFDMLLSQFGGPFLFGKDFTIADAFYAPVVGRLVAYDVQVPSRHVGEYVTRIDQLPEFKEWREGAKAQAAQGDFIKKFEIYAASKL